jgi:chemotaxis signal transduction protein
MLPDVAGAYVVFGIGEALFGAPIDQVTEVLDLTQRPLERLIQGSVLHTRGEIFETQDLAPALGFDRTKLGTAKAALLTQSLAALVDQVCGIRIITRSQIDPRFKVAAHGEELIRIVDLHALIQTHQDRKAA